MMRRGAVVVALAVAGAACFGLGAAPRAARADDARDSLAAFRKLISANQLVSAEARVRAWLAGLGKSARDDTLRAAGLDALTEVLLNAGKWKTPEDLAVPQQAIEAQEKLYGKDSPQAGNSLIMRARVMYRAGDWDAARPLAERGLTLCERAYGEKHLTVMRGLHYLANIYENQAEFAAAEKLYHREIAVAESLFGANSAQLGNAMNSLGVMYKKTGRLSEARPLYERALAIREQALGPNSADLAFNLNNLGNLLTDMGDLARAHAMFQRALDNVEKQLGQEHPYYPFVLGNLAACEIVMGDTAQALVDLQRTVTLTEKSEGPDTPDIAASLVNLGILWTAGGEFARADSSLARALAIRVKAFGPDRPEVARTLEARANLRLAQARIADADSDARRALDIRSKNLDATHPDVAGSLIQLAGIRFASGDEAGALDLAVRGEKASLERFRLTARVLEERLALQYAATRPSGLDLALSVAANGSFVGAAGPTGQRSAAAPAWQLLMDARARVLDEMALRHRAIAAHLDPATTALSDSFDAASEQLAWLLASGADGSADGRAKLKAARDRKERAEFALASHSAVFREQEAPQHKGLSDALDALPPGGALVAFARYRQAPPAGTDLGWYMRPGAEPAREQYLALVAKSRDAQFQVVPLGPAAGVDSAIARFVREAGRRPNPLTVTKDEARARTLGLTVRRLVWDPIAPALEGAREILIVPDGAILLLNFAALPGAPGKYLVEEAPPIHALTTERDLLVSSGGPGAARGLLAMGDPEFGVVDAGAKGKRGTTRGAVAADAAADGGPGGAPSNGGLDPPRSASSDCADFRSLRFEPLPQSGGEAQAVAAAWRAASAESARVLVKGNASEAAFRELAPDARWLHLATHGFFLPNVCGGVDAAGARVADTVAYQNPLLRSGLALSGANLRARAASGADDGVLTADEIAKLDLAGVETAVLSACETGQGDVHAGEGVLGLRRGFQIAGARSVVMSLWAVDDAATREWMSAFYVARVKRGLDLAQAVRAADLSVLFARRQRGESDHPFYWGAFVAGGAWR
jgi:CHAT domain-containing protein/tetratricopeptide (TPR) repeat protein